MRQRQDETKQDKTNLEECFVFTPGPLWARMYYTRRGNETETRQDKTRQDMTRQNKRSVLSLWARMYYTRGGNETQTRQDTTRQN